MSEPETLPNDPDPAVIPSPQHDVQHITDSDIKLGSVEIEQVGGALDANDAEQFYGQRSKKVKQCPNHLFVVFKRERDKRRPSWGFNKAFIKRPRMLMPGLENIIAGRRIATEVVPQSHQSFQLTVSADTNDDAYYDHKIRLVYSIQNPVKFLDNAGLDATTPNRAAEVSRIFFEQFMAPIIETRLDALTKKVSNIEINHLNAHPRIVRSYVFDSKFDVEKALLEIKSAKEKQRPPELRIPDGNVFDAQWEDFFDGYGVRLERYTSSIDQSAEVARENLALVRAAAAAKQSKIEADARLYVAQKNAEADAAASTIIIGEFANALRKTFGKDFDITPERLELLFRALSEHIAITSSNTVRQVIVNTGQQNGGSNLSEIVSAMKTLEQKT